MGHPNNMDFNRRSGRDRRKGWGLLAFYLAGGMEQRLHRERRIIPAPSGKPTNSERRVGMDRRMVIDTKYLNCGKCIDRRKTPRRIEDNIDEEAVERERYERLGPGWL